MGTSTMAVVGPFGLAASAALSLTGAARADDFQVGRQISAEAVFAHCPTGRGVVTANCLGGQERTLQAVLKARVARQLADIAEIASRPSGPGMLSGAATAEAWKRDFQSAQASWESYDGRQCQNLFDYDYHGGSAAGMFQTACRIRHLVARINELAEP